MQTITVNLNDIFPDPKNTVMHDEENIRVIKDSLKKFKQYRDFVVQKKGMVIRIGNGMYRAMKELGWKQGTAKVLDLTDKEAEALSILDNKSSEFKKWDDEMLKEIIGDLPKDLQQITGFDDSEIENFVNENNEVVENAFQKIKLTGDFEKDSEKQVTAVQSAFRDRYKKEGKRMQDAIDSEYWVCVCFKNREDKEKFLEKSGLIKEGDKYLDGYNVASILGIPVTDESSPA